MRPIGLYDSGLGGLSVFKELYKLMPNENYLYYADTKNLPYGEKTMEELEELILRAGEVLTSSGVKAIVIACNTASMSGVKLLSEKYHIPVIGIIDPCVKAIKEMGDLKKIGVIATERTVKEAAYKKKLAKEYPGLEVVQKNCQELVFYVEDGDYRDLDEVVEKSLRQMKEEGLDALVLACTHYAIIKEAIGKYIGIRTLDPAYETARTTYQTLKSYGLLEEGDFKMDFLVTGDIEKFRRTSKNILGKEVGEVKKI